MNEKGFDRAEWRRLYAIEKTRLSEARTIIKAGRFPKQADELRLYRAIATMNRKAPVPRLADQTPTWARATALARKWQLTQLAGRLELANTQARNAQH